MTMQQIKNIEIKVAQATKLLMRNSSPEVCDTLLDAWEDIKALMQKDSLKDINQLQARYPWQEYISNWVQDLEQELHNAGLENPSYWAKRLVFCEELLARLNADEQLIIENTRRALADSHFALGHISDCDRLYQAWLIEDPTWGWGYIGWSDCYAMGFGKTETDLDKAAEIIGQALAVPNILDRDEVIRRAIDIHAKTGDQASVAALRAELNQLQPRNESLMKHGHLAQPVQAQAEHIGRNDPCPCGSGKKYKKCCGK